MPGEFIATAAVNIQPNLAGFRSALTKQVTAATAKPIPIKVTPVIPGFRKTIAAALRNMTPVAVPITPLALKSFTSKIRREMPPATVEVIPDLTTFRAQYEAKVASAMAGAFVEVPVLMGGTVGLQAVLAALTSQLHELAAAQEVVMNTGSAADVATKRQEKGVRLLTEATDDLKVAKEAYRASLRKTNTDEEAATLANTAAARSRKAYQKAVEADVILGTKESRQLKLNAEQFEHVRTSQASVIATRKAAREQVELQARAEALATRIKEREIKVMSTEAKQLHTLDALKKQEVRVRGLARNAAAAEEIIIEAGLPTRAAEIAEIEATALAELELIATRREAIRAAIADASAADVAARKAAASQAAAAKAAISQQRFAVRGAQATGLSLLGIRGATLAANQAFLAGAAAVTLFALAVKSAADLETELNVFRETAGATATELEHVREVAEELGRDIRLPGVSAADAAQAMTGLARAGLSVQDAVAGAAGTLQLAIAANIELAEAVEIVASGLNAFGKAGVEAIDVADTLANAANLAQGTILDMGVAFQQAAAVGRQAGLTFEDTATFLTILAKAGLRGSDAGTSLRTGLIRLINPTAKAQKILDKLNVSIRDMNGNIRPDVFQNLAAATADMSKAQRDQTIAQLAGNDAVRAFTIIMRQSLPDLLEFRAGLRESGTAAALTEARAEGLAGKMKGLASNVQTSGIAVGRYFTPALTSAVVGLDSAVVAMSDSDQAATLLGGTFTSLGNVLEATGTVISSVVVPPLKLLADVTFSVVESLGGVGPILAALAAFKLFGPTLAILTAGFGGLKTALGLTLSIFSMWNTSVVATGPPLMTLSQVLRTGASALHLYAIGISVAAAGLVYLISRQTAAEAAAKSLTKANDALAESMARQNTAERTLAAAERATAYQERAVETAQLAAAQARVALATTDAAKGTSQYTQLQNDLATALQDVVFAQQLLDESLEDQRIAYEENQAAIRAEGNARAKAAQSLNDSIALSNQMVQTIKDRLAEERKLTPERAAEAEARGRERILEMLDKEIDKRVESESAAEREIAGRMILLQRLIERMKKVPTTLEITAFLNEGNVTKALLALAPAFGIEGKKDGQAWVQGVLTGIFGEVPKLNSYLTGPFADGMQKRSVEAGLKSGGSIVDGMIQGMKDKEAELLAALGIIFTRLENQSKGLAEQADILTIETGGRATPQQRLAQARREQANLEARLATIQSEAAIRGWTPNLIKKRREIRDQLASNAEEIASIEDEIAADAQEAADKIAEARNEADAAVLRAFENRESKRLRALQRAAQTEWLTDDIIANRALKRFYERQRKLLRARIQDAETEREALDSLQDKYQDVLDEIKNLRKQQAENVRDRIREAFELDISFFQTTENVAGEIRARRRFIAYLRRLQDETKKGTNAYKRLRNEIAEQLKAIDDLKDTAKDRNNALASLLFEFMQAQQGFAANLLGNLIPMGAAGGLVGNVSPVSSGAGQTPTLPGTKIDLPRGAAIATGPQGPLTRAAARAEGQGRPPTRFQANTEIELLRLIADILTRMEQGTRNPAAKQSRATARASYAAGLPHGAAVGDSG